MVNYLGALWDRLYFYLIAPGRTTLLLNLALRIIAVFMVGLLIVTLMKAKRTTKHEFRIIEMSEGLNTWELVYNEKLSFKHGKYEIEPEALYKVRPRFGDRVRWFINGIDAGFIIVFKKDTATAIKFARPTRSAEVLLTVEQSRALGRALRDEFKQAIGGRTIWIIIFVIVVGVLVYYFYTGRIGR